VSGRPGAVAADELTSEEEEKEEEDGDDDDDDDDDEGSRDNEGVNHAWARHPAPRLPAPRKDALDHNGALDRAAANDSRRHGSKRSHRGDVATRQPRGAIVDEEGGDVEAGDRVHMLPPRRSRLRYLSVMADTERDLDWYKRHKHARTRTRGVVSDS
jgi:hypothetical protein